MVFFGPGVHMGLGGGVALSLLMIPIVVRSSEEMLKLVPADLREAAYALGVPKWKTIVKVVLPTALAGIITGITLAIARVIGETAPLLIIAGSTDSTNFNLFKDQMMTLPVFIYYSYTQPGNHPEIARPMAWGAALVLILIVLVLNVAGSAARQDLRPQDGPLTTPAQGPFERNTMAKSIDISDLDIYYGDFLAVEGVSLTIPARSVTAFIGPSGCGKSTFLRSLNRMHEVIPGARVEGKVVVDGQSLYDSAVDPVEVRRMIGMVFQRPNPFPTMSIYENVLAGLRLNNKRLLPKTAADDVVEKSLRGANLWNEVKDRLGKPGMGLSGGQQQRLCIARAIAVEPQVLLMDEPCSALDPISTSAIEDLIHELKTEYTIVIVTHNMQQAARVSEDTAFFNIAGANKPGKLIEMNPTKKIFSVPDEPATEAYISGRFG